MTNTFQKVMSWCYKRLSQQGRRDSARKTQPVSLGWILLMDIFFINIRCTGRNPFFSTWYLSVYPMVSLDFIYNRWFFSDETDPSTTVVTSRIPRAERLKRKDSHRFLPGFKGWLVRFSRVDDIHDIRIPVFVVMKINTTLYKDP